jgi:hypothetical protein
MMKKRKKNTVAVLLSLMKGQTCGSGSIFDDYTFGANYRIIYAIQF